MTDFYLEQLTGPHQGARVHVRGNVTNPSVALVLLHGRGTSPEHIVQILGSEVPPPHVVIFAPEAKNSIWFPGRFFDPLTQNEPHLSSCLELISVIISEIERRYGIHKSHTILAGFSQGASLVSQYLATSPAQFRGACIYSGALFGETEEVIGMHSSGSLLQTPIYMGCDVLDPHVPLFRFQKTKEVLSLLGADITYAEYEGLRHAIHPDGITYLGQLLRMTMGERSTF